MSITGISALSGTPLIAAASQTTRNLEGNISTGNQQVFTWPKDGAPDTLHIKDYNNNEQFIVDSQGPLWWNDTSNTGVRLSKADAQNYKKISSVVNMNSYDNPGWETAGTITTGNPFGLAINPSLLYNGDYYISNSRCVSRYLGNSLWNIDLYVGIAGEPKADYATYNNFLTIQSGHISAPVNSNVYDEWNSCFGCIYKNTIYDTACNFNAVKPYDATRTHYINLHMLVAEW